MAEFDNGIWCSRAQTRYVRAMSSGISKSVALKQRDRDLFYIGALANLVDWCNQRTIQVIFCRRAGGIYFPENKQIKISGRLAPEKQVFFLLHECGHHLIGDKEKHERFGMGYSQTDEAVQRTFRHRCDIIDEEYEAWHRGYKLSKRLNLRVDKEKFDVTRADMLRTYFKWALKIGGYGRDQEEGDDDDEKTLA